MPAIRFRFSLLAVLSLLVATALASVLLQSETDAHSASATSSAAVNDAQVVQKTIATVYGKVTVIPAKPGRQNQSLWERLEDGFDLGDKSEDDVQQALAEFKTHRHSTQRLLARSAPYLWELVDAVESRGLPTELSLLPAIESRFNPLAHSHKRAVGLWQLIPRTAAHLGLEQNWWFDARLDVIESTLAALNYLEYLHKRFGSWTLALAAYNCGEARLQRAINLADGNTDFWELGLPKETKDYVPRLLALSLLIEDSGDYGIRLPALSDQQATDTLIFNRQVDLALVARLAGVELSVLQYLNPAQLRWATPPDGPHRLRLPAGKSKKIQSAMAEIPADLWTLWQTYMVKEGDILQNIAEQSGIQVADLQQVNQMHSSQIRIGDTLFLPSTTFHAGNYSFWGSQSQEIPENAVRVDYLVKPGDTLWDIAKMFRVSVEELHRWNGLASGSILRPGKSLIVWIAADSRQSA